MALYSRYEEAHGAFVNYEDFYKNFRLRRPEGFQATTAMSSYLRFCT